MEPMKLAGIRDWPTSSTMKQVWSFLGFGNFYQQFIGHYSELARPLNDLTKKDKVWKWSNNCQEAFNALKREFLKAPVLLISNSTKPFILESDEMGNRSRQQDINGNWHPCRYISHSFGTTQHNYKIYDRELLGIVYALETWHHYLQGSPFPTVILSDYKNLTYFWTAQKLNRQQAQWSLFLSEFDLKLLHTLLRTVGQKSKSRVRWLDETEVRPQDVDNELSYKTIPRWDEGKLR